MFFLFSVGLYVLFFSWIFSPFSVVIIKQRLLLFCCCCCCSDCAGGLWQGKMDLDGSPHQFWKHKTHIMRFFDNYNVGLSLLLLLL